MSTPPARSAVPLLGLLALAALFLSLPEAPNLCGHLGGTTCSSRDPYLPLIGAGYFAALVAVSLLFPGLPGPLVARGGLTWAVLLALGMTYVKWPGVCPACLVAHTCNVLIWSLWLVVPSAGEVPGTTVRERLFLALFAPVAVIALFSTLNLTFGVYGFHAPSVAPTRLQNGDEVPDFTTATTAGRGLARSDAARGSAVVINFVAPQCPYCKDQLPKLNAVARELAAGPYRFVNVTPALSSDLTERAPDTEWIEDRGDRLRKLFQVNGSPTLFVLGGDGKIAHIIAGVPDQFEAELRTSLVKPKGPGS